MSELTKPKRRKACERKAEWSSSTPPIAKTKREVITRPADVFAKLRDLAGEQEDFYVILLDIKNQLIGTEHVGRGSPFSVEVHPREIFKAAIRSNAVGIILAHNHPSGDVTPSPDDLTLTERMRKVGDLVGIPVIDHIVFSSETFTSIAEYQP